MLRHSQGEIDNTNTRTRITMGDNTQIVQLKKNIVCINMAVLLYHHYQMFFG